VSISGFDKARLPAASFFGALARIYGMTLLLGSILGGFIDADPTIAALLIGVIVAAAVTFVVLRVRASRRGE
jgi:hypothetical protein